MAVTVRAMAASDIAAVTALAHQLGYPEAVADVAERFAAISSRPDHATWVAEEQGEVVGWIHAFEMTLLEVERTVEVGGLVVAEGARRRGVGAKLLQAAEEWTDDRGVAVIWLRSRDTRADAHRFYLGIGYEHVKTSLTLAKRLRD